MIQPTLKKQAHKAYRNTKTNEGYCKRSNPFRLKATKQISTKQAWGQFDQEARKRKGDQILEKNKSVRAYVPK